MKIMKECSVNGVKESLSWEHLIRLLRRSLPLEGEGHGGAARQTSRIEEDKCKRAVTPSVSRRSSFKSQT